MLGFYFLHPLVDKMTGAIVHILKVKSFYTTSVIFSICPNFLLWGTENINMLVHSGVYCLLQSWRSGFMWRSTSTIMSCSASTLCGISHLSRAGAGHGFVALWTNTRLSAIFTCFWQTMPALGADIHDSLLWMFSVCVSFIVVFLYISVRLF